MSLEHRQQRIRDNILVAWLDPNINETNANFQYSSDRLQRFINSIKIFVDTDQCIAYLTEIKNDKTFLIISDVIGQQLIPLILQDLEQLDAVYLFCSDKTKHEQWIKAYTKVKGVFDQIESLCDLLERDTHPAVIDLLSISIVSTSSAIDLNQLDQSFMYSQLLKEVLLSTEFDDEAKKEFVEFCRLIYADDHSRLRVIDEFERDYDSESTIRWYTRDCFIYWMLNKALRTQDVEIILKMGFFIRDLHQQIKYLHSNSENQSLLTVHRGQGIFNDEFEKMRKNEGGLLSFNNFLSTSIDRQVSWAFADCARQNDELTGVMFQTEIDPKILMAPFASVNNVSYFSDSEEEILFSMHTIFRIGEMKQLENRLWEIKLTLTNDNDEELKRLTDHMHMQIEQLPQFIKLPYLMLKMGKFNKAEEMYKKTVELISDNDWDNNALIHSITGFIIAFRGDRNMDVAVHYQKALEIRQKSFPSDHPNIAVSYNNIGSVYRSMGNCPAALSNFKMALEIHQKSLPIDYHSIAMMHNNIGMVYQLMGEYSTAISHCQNALENFQKILPPNPLNIATALNNIGLLQKCLGEYPTALVYLEKSLDIRIKFLPPDHSDLAIAYANMGSLCEAIEDYLTALSYCEKALEINQQSLQPNHPTIAKLHNNIGSLYNSMGDYSSALLHHKKALDIRQDSLPSNHSSLATSHNNIAESYRLKGDYSIALLHYKKALDIAQQSLPFNHPNQATFNSNISIVYRDLGRFKEAIQYATEAVKIATNASVYNQFKIQTYQNFLDELMHQYDNQSSLERDRDNK